MLNIELVALMWWHL